VLIPEKLDLPENYKKKKDKKSHRSFYLDTARFPSICSILYFQFLLSIQIALFEVLSCRVACYAVAVCLRLS